MTKVELKEKYKVDDFHSKVRGIVTVKNLEDGTILFTKENTVVEQGRNLLLNSVFGSISGTPLFSFYMSKEESTEIFSDKMETIIGSNENSSIIFKKDITSSPNGFMTAPQQLSENPSENSSFAEFTLEKEDPTDEDRLTVTNHIRILINPNDGASSGIVDWGTAKSAGLMFTLDSGEHYALFSRVTFEGITLKENAKYLIDYYIYF